MQPHKQSKQLYTDPDQCRHKIISTLSRSVPPPPPDLNLYDPTAVMALFLFNQTTPDLLFIQKADVAGYPWRNQMAFPGGHVDDTDDSPLETALREVEEELGIHPENVEIIGSLGHFQTINHKDIQAFSGIWDQQEPIQFDSAEIRRIFQIPIPHLMTLHREKGYMGQAPPIMDLTYPFEDVVIWGVTAKILHHMLETLFQD